MRERDQRAAQFADERDHLGQFVAQIEPQVERDLVVARARGMQLAPGRADPLGQAALDREMDVFVGKIETGSGRASISRSIARSPATILARLGAP